MSKRSRRAWVALAAAGTLALTACSSGDGGSSGESDSLTFTSYGSGYQEAQSKAWLQPFAEAEGIKAVEDQPTDYAKIKAMVDAGRVTWDVVDTEPFFPVGNCGTYVEKLDFTVIDTSGFPEGTVSDCAVPAAMYSLVFVYNTEKYKDNPPKSIADFFDTKTYPGTRLVPGFATGGAIEMALLGDGVPVDKLYPLDYDRAFAKLDSIMDNLSFWNTSAESQQALETRTADMALVWSGRAYLAEVNGASYTPIWDDAMLAYATLSIPKGAPHKDLAMKFIAYATGPEPQARFAELQPYAPVHKDAKPKLDEKAQKWNTAREDIQKAGFFQNVEWWAQNQDEATKRWTAWTTG